MDASGIITQASRDEEQTNSPHSIGDSTNHNGGMNNSNKKRSCSSSGSRNSEANSFLKRLFSCCWRSPSSTTNDGDESSSASQPPPRTASTTTTSTNGAVAPEDPPSVGPPPTPHLLPPLLEIDQHKKCMVIDLDETLVHSSFKPISNADFVVPVEIDGTVHQVYVLKRPNVDEFLQKMGELYECILFTASLAKYADPVADLLDKWNVFRGRLFRESCVFHRGNYVKDLSRLGRDLTKVVIMDNSPASYIFHPDNAVPVSSWFDDMTDSELIDLLPFLETLSHVDSVYSVLRGVGGSMGPPQPPPLLAPLDSSPAPPNSSLITQVAPPPQNILPQASVDPVSWESAYMIIFFTIGTFLTDFLASYFYEEDRILVLVLVAILLFVICDEQRLFVGKTSPPPISEKWLIPTYCWWSYTKKACRYMYKILTKG